MALFVLGVNHKTAPAALREKIAFSQGELEDALKTLLASGTSISEAVLLSTCNRTEVYAVGSSAYDGMQQVKEFMRSYKSLSEEDMAAFEESKYFSQSRAMVRKIFYVVCSLDSMVLGEAQILGQVRHAYMAAKECGATGEMLNKLFKQALELGKNARSQTQIGSQSVSISTVAVNLTRRFFDTLDGKSILIIGAGEMAELSLGYLREQGDSKLFVANRTRKNAVELVERFSADKVFTLDQLKEAIRESDVVLSSAYYPDGFLVTRPLVEQARLGRDDSPLLLIDVAMPRNIEPTCNQIENVFCFSLDDLESIIDDNKQAREQEAEKVRKMIREGVDSFSLWMQEREVIPTVKDIYRKAQIITDREVAKGIKELRKVNGSVSAEEEQVLAAMANAIMRKMVHGPVIRIKKQCDNPSAYVHTDAARYLFGLDANPDALPCGNRESQCMQKLGHPCSAAALRQCPFGNTLETEEQDER